MNLISINPATGEEVNSYQKHTTDEVQKILKHALSDQSTWSQTHLNFKKSCIENLAGSLRDNSKEFASLMAQEMGKPVSQGLVEVEKCAWLCDYYVENADKFLKDTALDISGQKSLVTIRPIGLVLGIMPWNFPFWQVYRFAIPTITVGNGAILKHASNVQGCATAIESTFKDAGFPENIFRNIVVPGREVDTVIKSPEVSAITLTGSTPAGKSVASIAGSVLKKTVLELGGSDPYIILKDAEIENAVDSCIAGRALNAGQSCIAAKRLIVVESIYDHFINMLEKRLASKIMGDPFDKVDIGPMVSIMARGEVHEQVLNTIKQGANCILGGEIPDGIGAYYPITLLTDVKPGMTAFDEEIFGPVFSVTKATNENDALALANQTTFGLGAAIFTKDKLKGEEIARNQLNAGLCFVNDFVKSDPRLPFGGIKDSGYGRELSSFGMMEFVNLKTVVVKN